MIFEKKKLNTETLGEYLSEVRSHAGLHLDEVSKKTGIKEKFLEHLESGEFHGLPPDVYVAGFLRQLASIYSVEADLLIGQYRKERNIQQQVRQADMQQGSWVKIFFSRLVITPKLISLAAGAMFVLVTLGYVVWQISSINRTPSLEIFEPQDRQVIKSSLVNIRGKTDPGMIVTVNGGNDNIFVDNQGNFKTQLGIAAGQKELTVTARNKFDKSVTKTVSIVAEDEMSVPAGQVQLKLEFSDTVILKVSIDGGLQQTITFHQGDVKQYVGQKSIVISTSDAGATKATLNGQVLSLGRANESLENISFFPNAGNASSSQ